MELVLDVHLAGVQFLVELVLDISMLTGGEFVRSRLAW